MKKKELKLMTGHIWWFTQDCDVNELKTLKDFETNRINEPPLDKVFGGNIIPKQPNKEEHIIFECLPFYGTRPAFRLFLYPNNTTWGTIEYQKDPKYPMPKEYFKGNYKKTSKNKITIWGIWSNSKEVKIGSAVMIELSR